jgi:hypothetical protein
MATRKNVDSILNAQAMNDNLPDGKYLTSPKWGYSEREVIIKDGKLSLVGDVNYKFSFSQSFFFEVNDVLETLPL